MGDLAGKVAFVTVGNVGIGRKVANAACAGFRQETPLHASFTSPDDQDAIVARLVVCRCGSPSDVAALVGYLVAESTNFVTGQAITASGGELA